MTIELNRGLVDVVIYLAALPVLYIGIVKFKKLFYLQRAKTALPAVSRTLSKWIRHYDYTDRDVLSLDGANPDVVQRRQQGLTRLESALRSNSPLSIELSKRIREGFSDLRFTDANRVPFQFRKLVNERLNVASIVCESSGPKVKDVDGNWALDVSGSYGVNVVGYDRYKTFITEGWDTTKNLGPVLGPLHPLVADNIDILKKFSRLDEVSFHMSGTEAVMAAVRSARFNTRRKLIVCFSGAYHGWWDGVQPGLGSEREMSDCLTLKDMHPSSLRALVTNAKSIAGVLINPIQSFHPNSSPPNDAVLVAGEMRTSDSPYEKYKRWLHEIRKICTEHAIPLIFDEVYTGFRLAPGGAQEYFDIQADMVVYGKTVAGGMPIGVVCGKRDLMKRFDEKHPLRLAYVVGTFSAHPHIMGTMNAFLRWVMTDEASALYIAKNREFAEWVKQTNQKCVERQLPIEITHMSTIWTVMFKCSSRYHWMFQYYLRAQGISLSWVGSGRCLVSFDFEPENFAELQEKVLAAAARMKADGWWWQDAKNPLTDKSIKKRILVETLVNIARVPQSAIAFVSEIMKRKHDDHIASHSNTVNQFLHLISSSLFIYSYCILISAPVLAVCLGFAALVIRQAGHALLEPPCHDKEALLLGFTTRSKTILVSAYLMPTLLCLIDSLTTQLLPIAAWTAKEQIVACAYYWLTVSVVAIGGNVASLLATYGIRTSMIWFVKLITDPFTDVVAYYPSVITLTRRLWSSNNKLHLKPSAT